LLAATFFLTRTDNHGSGTIRPGGRWIMRACGWIGWAPVAAALLLGGCDGTKKDVKDPESPGPKLKVTSTAFTEGAAIPRKYSGEGDDVSPPLKWEAAPEKTRSLAVLVEDPDAPKGTFIHWVLFNLPADTRELAEGAAAGKLPEGAVQGKNDFGKTGYGGPKPPAGKAHRYYFKVFALDTKLDLEAKARHAEVADAMRGHVLAEGAVMGTYQHGGKKE
jgi:Raf kinase inhibitor-like YbhB/YbcL family protein